MCKKDADGFRSTEKENVDKEKKMTKTLLFIIIALSLNSNSYAETSVNSIDTPMQESVSSLKETDKITIDEIIKLILDDYDFMVYMKSLDVSEKEIDDILHSEYFSNYVEFELEQTPEEDDILASWDIIDWHIKKIERFINYLFTGNKDYTASTNTNNNNYNNGYNNMMPPPPPPPPYFWNNNQWRNNQWRNNGQNTNWNNGYNNWNNNSNNNNVNNTVNDNSCNCDCDNCKNCLCK